MSSRYANLAKPVSKYTDGEIREQIKQIRRIKMPRFSVVLVCPHCGSQMTQEVNTHATQSVTCKSSNGGCGKSYRVYTGDENEIKKVYK